jgi:hypothetical protein
MHLGGDLRFDTQLDRGRLERLISQMTQPTVTEKARELIPVSPKPQTQNIWVKSGLSIYRMRTLIKPLT